MSSFPSLCSSSSINVHLECPIFYFFFIWTVFYVAFGNLYLGAIVAKPVKSIGIFPVVSLWIQARP